MLTDAAVRRAKPQEKPYKIPGSGGLHVLVKPNGYTPVATEISLWRQRETAFDRRISRGFAIRCPQGAG